MKLPKRNYAFVDGTFHPEKLLCGYACMIVDQYGKKHIFKGTEDRSEYVRMRNVGGEILAAEKAVIIAASMLGMKQLTIFYDYQGIEKWASGEWKAKKRPTKEYVAFMQTMLKYGFKIYFCHVRAHSGNRHNEEVDLLAKEAVGLR